MTTEPQTASKPRATTPWHTNKPEPIDEPQAVVLQATITTSDHESVQQGISLISEHVNKPIDTKNVQVNLIATEQGVTTASGPTDNKTQHHALSEQPTKPSIELTRPLTHPSHLPNSLLDYLSEFLMNPPSLLTNIRNLLPCINHLPCLLTKLLSLRPRPSYL